MFKYYLIVKISIAFILLTVPTQSQEIPQKERSQPSQQQKFHELTFPLPIQITKDQDSARLQQIRDEKNLKIAEDGLLTQKDINKATWEMTKANQSMSCYALISTILVGLGTILLTFTLFYTRKATHDTAEAVKVTRDIGNSQLRAYLGITRVWVERGNPRLMFNIKNFGQTPAYSIAVRTYSRRNYLSGTIFRKDPHLFKIMDPTQEWVGSFPIGKGLHDSQSVIEEAEVVILLKYKDMGGNLILRRHCFELHFDSEIKGKTVDFGLRGEGTRERFYFNRVKTKRNYCAAHFSFY